MPLYLQIILAVVALIVLLLIVLIVKAATFTDKEKKPENVAPVKVDEKRALADFTELLRCKTVSVDTPDGDRSEFDKFQALTQKFYPTVYEKCEKEMVDGYGYFFKLKGKSDKAPSVIMSHYDVVPVNEDQWDHPPFEAYNDGKTLWARGAIDNKATLTFSLEALEDMLKEGYVPANDLYLAFGGDEELRGDMQQKIVALMKERKIYAKFVLDEGGAITKNVFPGVPDECAMVGVCEKGIANVVLTVKGQGGHASTPSKNDPLNVIARALVKLENSPMKPEIVTPVAGMLNALGRHTKFGLKIIFANMWLFKGLVAKLFSKLSAETNAMVTTTFAYTTITGSKAFNVVPVDATVNINIRIAPNHNIDQVVAHIKNVIDDDRVLIEVPICSNPSPVADINGYAFNTVKAAVQETFPEAIVSPYVMLAASDSRHYRDVADGVIKFAPLVLSKEQRGTVHANNERIEISAIARGVEFYKRLYQKI